MNHIIPNNLITKMEYSIMSNIKHQKGNHYNWGQGGLIVITEERLMEILQERDATLISQVVMAMKEANEKTFGHNEFINTKQVAEKLCIYVSTVNRWADSGLLKKHRLGAKCVRYKSGEIEEFLINKKNTLRWKLAA